MNEYKMRVRLAKALGLEDVPELIWEDLKEEGYIDKVMEVPSVEWEDLLHDTRRSLKFFRAGAEGKTAAKRVPAESEPVVPAALFQENELNRARVVAAALAKRAETELRVRNFRRNVLGGQVLTPEQARAFVTSPATRYFSREQFERWHIPLVDHVATVVNSESMPEGEENKVCVTISVDPPGITQSVSQRHSGQRVETLGYPSEDGRSWKLIVPWPHSVLDELRQVSVRLAKNFQWREGATTWFVLTGAIPQRAPVKQRWSVHWDNIHSAAHVTLAIEPWVSADTVLRIYRDAQRSILGGDNRPIGLKNLDLFHFVVDQAEDGKLPPWKKMMLQWNDTHAELQYDDVSSFARAYRRTEQALMFPKYKHPW